MVTVLNEANNLAGTAFGERTRTVRLAENYHNSIYELLAKISDSQVVFTKLDDDENGYDEEGDPIRHPDKNYFLTAPEADAFVEAWTAYKADRAAALEAEEQRKAGVLAKANELAAELGLDITATEPDSDGDVRYTLKHPVRYVNLSYGYGPDSLLGSVKAFQTELEEERKTIAEARSVAGKIMAVTNESIDITSGKPAYNGKYTLKIGGRFNGYSVNQVSASHVLSRLQAILRDLDSKQAQTESALS
jgi:hypothetical protein